MKRTHAIFTVVLLLVDVNMSLLAFYIAYKLRVLTQGAKDRPL